MREFTTRTATFFTVAALTGLLAVSGTAQAQSGRIVCWKDASGKVVGCGDKVPPVPGAAPAS